MYLTPIGHDNQTNEPIQWSTGEGGSTLTFKTKLREWTRKWDERMSGPFTRWVPSFMCVSGLLDINSTVLWFLFSSVTIKLIKETYPSSTWVFRLLGKHGVDSDCYVVIWVYPRSSSTDRWSWTLRTRKQLNAVLEL